MTVLPEGQAREFWSTVPEGDFRDGRVRDLGARLCQFVESKRVLAGSAMETVQAEGQQVSPNAVATDSGLLGVRATS